MDAIFNWLWQGGAVAVAWFVMLLGLERARANLRYVVCWAASLVIIALPAVPMLRSAAISAGPLAATPTDPIVFLPDAWWTSTIVIFSAWTVWVSVHVIRFASAIVTIRRARARSRAFPSSAEADLRHWRRIRGEGRRATLVLSDAVATAAVLGWGPPMIAVAPALVTLLDADELDRVLVHEWAHVQRRDDLVNVLQVVLRMIAGWHPALWWIDRRLQIEREIACDEITLALTGSAKSYAACLMKLASLRGIRRAMETAPAVLPSSGLRARVIKIVSPRSAIAPAWSRSIAAALITTLCGMCIGLGGLPLVQASALAWPSVSDLTFGATPDRLAPVAVPALSADSAADRGAPRAGGWAQSARPATPQQPPAPQAATEPDPGARSAAANPVGAASEAEADETAELLPAKPLATEPQMAPDPHDVATEQSPAPWTAAASGGAALGRRSKDAGVATAGFFTRFARRLAGSF
jgi:beta-lactamase regulating signal transducer with metallopeptidase domain